MAGDDNHKGLLQIAIVVLCIAAGIVLLQILTAERIDSEESMKAFLTAIVVAFLSLGVGAGARLADRQPGIAPLGYLTILLGVVALLLAVDLIWRIDNPLEGFSTLAKWVSYTVIGTLALGLASTLLAGHEDDDTDAVKLVRGMTVFALFGVAVAVLFEISVSGQRVDPYVLGSFSVFYVLGSLVLPLLGRLTR